MKLATTPPRMNSMMPIIHRAAYSVKPSSSMNLRRWNRYTNIGVATSSPRNTKANGGNQSVNTDATPAHAKYSPNGNPASAASW